MTKHAAAIMLIISMLIGGCGKADENGTSEQSIHAQDFLASMEKNGLRLGKKREKMFGLIGAVEGFAIEVNGDLIEVYEYDTTIKSGRDLLRKFSTEGMMGQAAIAHKNLLLIRDQKHADWEKILNIFNST